MNAPDEIETVLTTSIALDKTIEETEAILAKQYATQKTELPANYKVTTTEYQEYECNNCDNTIQVERGKKPNTCPNCNAQNPRKITEDNPKIIKRTNYEYHEHELKTRETTLTLKIKPDETIFKINTVKNEFTPEAIQNAGFTQYEAQQIHEKLAQAETDYNAEQIIIPFNPTDCYTNAVAFYEKQPVHYDDTRAWYMWRSNRHAWVRVDETDILARFAGAVSNAAYTTQHTNKNELLESWRQISRQPRNKPEPFNEYWVQFGAQIYDARTGKLVCEATPAYFATNPIPWTPGESSDTPTIDRLFTEWVGEKWKPTLYEMFAYATLSKQALQRIFALVGSGSNGKGVCLKVLARFLGTDNIANTELKHLLGQRFETSAAYRKLALIMSEVNEDDMKNTGLIKTLTGEDRTRYEFKGHDPFSEESYATPIIATNTLPTTADETDGFHRRWLVIDFPHTFDINPHLLESIPEQEYHNLARRCLEISQRLLETGKFTNEGTIQERRERYQDRSNPVYAFINAECDTSDQDADIPFQEFLTRLNEWLKKRNMRTINALKCSKRLKENKFTTGKKGYWNGERQTTQTAIFGIKWSNSVLTSLTPKTEQKTVNQEDFYESR